MKYKVSRTSSPDEKPCEEALLLTALLKHGALRYYYMEINSQEELLSFIKKYGEVVIIPLSSFDKELFNGCEYEIEIYDDYRE